ncbi:glycosyltransferase family 2 protein [Streptomyces kaniharaensis]|uniref:Glycosyltransferase family 2 protein n=1 Tax=Streptomyces kaniharaensis TaxID=212423 RepID=A0A6N7KZ07_9ACTN|nr:glycosyltransferase family 2 protein [Streptomyces kaniharaensis]MQS15204.1 glycosyltransferase family 2 protein [Streptomyces kaniharaensis]
MNGYDRRTAAACSRPAARDSLYTPVRVVELDLDEPSELRSPGGFGAVDPDGRVLALVRLHGHPLGLVTATGAAGDGATLSRALVDAAHRELYVPALSTATPAARPGRVGRARVPADPPLVSVIVPTRDRSAMLPRCLDALLATDYPHVEVILVDNAPATDATEVLVRSRYGDRVRYVREPLPGGSRARNRGLAHARGAICAFTDDDTIADPHWVTAVVEAFQSDERIGCVTGLVVPAELETEAQLLLEEYSGPGRGFTARAWSLEALEDPLVQFSVGWFGLGANMAFRTDVLREVGGFDPATGPGTPSKGGEDLLAFQQVLSAGHTVAYQPDALIWHRHRRTMDDLNVQVRGFGVGFGAYLAASIAHQPRQLADLLRLLPYGVWRWHRSHRLGSRAALPERSALRGLRRMERRGLLYGPFCYLFTVWQQRHARIGG